MTSRAKRLAVSIAIGVAVLLIAGLPVPYLEFLSFPGVLLAAPFWPQGIHTSGMGETGALLMIGTVYAGTIAFWAAIAYAILTKRATRN